VARVADLMSTYGHDWSLCGGWAVDAWLGRQTRNHVDVDIIVFHDDRLAFFEHLAGWQMIAHDTTVSGNTAEPWNGRPLVLPAHIHARSVDGQSGLPDRLDDPGGQGFGLDVQVNERSGDDWIFSRAPHISLPLHQCVGQSRWGLPTLVPEVILFYKASELRRRDKLDFLALRAHLSEKQSSWLREAISLLGHPWLSELAP
jgi:hypothetical protein